MAASQRTIRFTLNGQKVSADIDLHWNLVDLLHRKFDLFGARESCAQGLCGCCTVLVDGRAVSGCLYLAARADGAASRRSSTSDPRRRSMTYRKLSSRPAHFNAAFAPPALC